MFNIAVQTKVIGAPPHAEPAPDVFFDVLSETLTVAELITRTVEEQIHDLTFNRRLDAARARDILDRQYMTEADVRAQASRGAVKMPAQPGTHPDIDVDQAVRVALSAFERGVVLVVVDGVQAETLDQPLHLHASSRATFMRMTPLVGG